MDILIITSATKMILFNELIEFIFENYFKQIEFVKERSYCLMKRFENKDLLLSNK